MSHQTHYNIIGHIGDGTFIDRLTGPLSRCQSFGPPNFFWN